MPPIELSRSALGHARPQPGFREQTELAPPRVRPGEESRAGGQSDRQAALLEPLRDFLRRERVRD